MHTGGGGTLKSAIFAHLGHPCPDLDLDLRSGHTAYRHRIWFKSEKLSVDAH